MPKFNKGDELKRGIDKNSVYFEEFSRFTKKLRQKIYALRKEKNLTQEQMEEYELSLRQFQRIEIGETTNITLSNIFKISKALGIRPCELLDI